MDELKLIFALLQGWLCLHLINKNSKQANYICFLENSIREMAKLSHLQAESCDRYLDSVDEILLKLGIIEKPEAKA